MSFKKQDKSKIIQIWGDILDEGFTSVPNLLLRYRANLGIKPQHLVLIIDIMSFKWDSQNPFPSYSALAQRAGVAERSIMRLVQDLEEMNLLIRKPRFDEETGAQITTIFDFRPLVQRLIEEMRKTQLEQPKETQTPEPVIRAGGGDKFVRGGVTNLSGGGVTNLSPKEDTYNNKTQLKNTHHNKVRDSKPSQQETNSHKTKDLRERVRKYFKNGIFRKRLFEVYDNLYEIKPFNELVEEGAYRACKEILVNRAREIYKSKVKLDPNKIATEIKSIFPYEAVPAEHRKARSFFVATICSLTAEKIVALLSPNN